MLKILTNLIIVLLVISTATLGFLYFNLSQKNTELSVRLDQLDQSLAFDFAPSSSGSVVEQQPSQANSIILPSPDTSFSEELSALKSYVDQSLATISATPVEKVTYVTQTTSSPQTSYIPLDSIFSTTSTDWADVPGSEVYIDLANDYSDDAYITWSASLKVAHGNGQAFARLYDATNNIAVSGSELSTSNNSTLQAATSNQLAFWRGNNLYKVQLKSLNSFEVTLSSAKIKLVY